VAHLKLAGKVDIRPPALSGRTRQEYALGEEGETVRSKLLLFTKDTVDQFNF
jgi:hypothetical protein